MLNEIFDKAMSSKLLFLCLVGGFVCPRDEKALEKCLRDSLNGIIPQLSTGEY